MAETVGVEIGSSAIKAVRVARRGKDVRILGYAYHRLPQRREGTDESHRPDRQHHAEALRLAVMSLGSGISEIALVLQGPGVIFRTISIPPMRGNDLRRAVRWQLGQWVGNALDKMVAQHRVAGMREENGKELATVQVVAVPRELIQEAMALATLAGLRVTSLTVPPVALEALLTRYGWAEEGVPLGVADLGANGGCVYVFSGGACEFAREFRATGDQITSSLTKEVQNIWDVGNQGNGETIQLTWAEAERTKKAHGLATTGIREGTTPTSPQFLAALMRPTVERLVREVRRSLDFAAQEVVKKDVGRLVLVGGTAKLHRLTEYMSRGVGAATRVFAFPEEALFCLAPRGRAALAARAPELAVALGLGLLGGDGIELVPPEVKARQRRARLRRRLVSTAVLAVTGIVVSWGFLALEETSLRGALTRQVDALRLLEQQDQVLQHSILHGPLAARNDASPAGEPYRRVISDFRHEVFAAEVWKALGYATPVQVEITRVEIKFPSPAEMSLSDEGEDDQDAPRAEAYLEGVARARNDEVDLVLLEFLLALEETPFFGSPEVTFRERQGDGSTTRLIFALDCPLE